MYSKYSTVLHSTIAPPSVLQPGHRHGYTMYRTVQKTKTHTNRACVDGTEMPSPLQNVNKHKLKYDVKFTDNTTVDVLKIRILFFKQDSRQLKISFLNVYCTLRYRTLRVLHTAVSQCAVHVM